VTTVAVPWRSRIVGHGEEAPDQLLANPRNWRIHPKAQQDALAGVLSEVGWVQEVIVNQQTGFVVDGHLRVAMAISRGEPSVPVVYVDLSEEEETLILATLDPLAGMAVAAKDALADLLKDVATKSDAMRVMLDALAKEAGIGPKDGLTDPDDVPEVPEEPVSKMGDLWLCGDHRLLCGDARRAEDVERLMAGAKASVIMADPPYGISYEHDARPARRPHKFDPIANDAQEGTAFQSWLEGTIRAVVLGARPNAAWYLWHAQKTQGYFAAAAAAAAAGIIYHRQIVWVKPHFTFGRGHYHWRHELCLMGWREGNEPPFLGERNQTTVWEIDYDGKKVAGTETLHPNQKPVAVIEPCIRNHAIAGEIILDPFLGSGTTMIACERLGRRCYGMEIEPHYVDVAVKRWEQFTGRKAVLGG